MTTLSDEETPTPEDTKEDSGFPFTGQEAYIPDTYLLKLRDIVKEEFVVTYAYIDAHDNLPIFVVEEDSKMKARSNRLTERLRPHNLLAVIRQIELFEGTGEKSTVIKLIPAPPPRRASSYTMNIILFAATVITVLYAGWFFAMSPALIYIYEVFFHIPYNPSLVMIAYTIALLAIIGLHEFGHVGASRYHHVEASMPYFIPGFYYGTFGALIVQRSPPPTRDSLFDLGISGPVVGFAISIVVVTIGLMMSPILSPAEFYDLSVWLQTIGLPVSSLPTPLLFDLILMLITLGLPPDYVVYIHPVAFAGWVGFLITALNYFPIGQLDGGHVSRALVGGRYHRIVSFVGIFFLFIFGYWFMAMIAFFLFAGRHPGPVDDVSSVSGWRKIVGPISYVMVFLLLPPLTTGFLFPFP